MFGINKVGAGFSMQGVTASAVAVLQAGGASGAELAATALVWLKDTGIVETSGAVTEWTNEGTGGAGYDLDVVNGTGANLRKSISDACLMYAGVGTYLSTPDTPANSITGDLDLRVRLSIDDISAGTYSIITKGDAAANRSWMVQANSNGTFYFAWWNSSAASTSGSSDAHGIGDGVTFWARVTLDVDNGAGGNDTKFYTSITDTDDSDLADWVQVGSTVTRGGVTNVRDTSSGIELGSWSSGLGSNLKGSLRRGEIYDGIGGTLVTDFNAADYVNKISDTVFPSTNTGENWTLNGDTYIQNTGHDAVHTKGAAGLETSPGQSITGKGTIFLVARASALGTTMRILESRSHATNRWLTQVNTSSKPGFYAGTAFVETTESLDTEPHLWTIQMNEDATTKLTVSGIGTVTANAGTVNWDFASMFTNYAGTGSFYLGNASALLVFDSALTDDEITTMQTYLTTTYSL